MKIFKFDERDITRHIEYELKTFNKMRDPFNYVANILKEKGHSLSIKNLDKVNFNKVKEMEGKSYHWSLFQYNNISLLVRRYRQHLTIFTKLAKSGEDEYGLNKASFGAFCLEVDLDKFGDKHDKMLDEYYSRPFQDLNVLAKPLFELLSKDQMPFVQNSHALPVENHVSVKLAFSEKEIYSFDSFIFCMEELDTIYHHLFSENTTLRLLTKMNEGDKIGSYTLGKIITEVKDGYYHSVGAYITSSNDSEQFKDVYSLTRWYMDEVFSELYMFEGEVYQKGGEFEVGKPVVYKGFEEVCEYREEYPKENFIPLTKV